ncbi:hypothetical protein D3C75_1049340 [compost metagenome]
MEASSKPAVTAATSSRVAAAAWAISPLISSIRLPISSEAPPVCSASFFTSAATTANPLPCSPALAASIPAFKARILVCDAMEVISPRISPMAPDFSSRSSTVFSMPTILSLISVIFSMVSTIARVP